MYSDIIRKQSDCYDSIKNFCTSESQLYPIKFYPQNEYYANKFGLDLNNLTKIDNNTISQKVLLEIAKIWAIFIMDSEYPIFDRKTGKGFWNNVSFKKNNDNQLMVKILVVGQWIDKINSDYFDQLIELVYNKCRIDTHCIYLQYSQNKSSPDKQENIQLFAGSNGIQENILGINFWITPFTFSQANPNTCEMLYETLHQFINIDHDKRSIICYGRNVGHICLTLKSTKNVWAYNPCPVVDSDLKRTLTSNIISINIQLFLDTKCELISDKLNLLDQYDKSNYLLIVSPGRNGLKNNVIQAIKQSRSIIKEFYYVSCYSKSLIRDLKNIENCHIEKAQAIDLFPSTEFCETIVKIVL